MASASSRSPAPPGTSDGFVASIATRLRVSATTSAWGIRSPDRTVAAADHWFERLSPQR